MGTENKNKDSFTINKRNVEALPFVSRSERKYVNEGLEGFGTPIGERVKAFNVEKRVNGKPKHVTLGRFPVMGCEQEESQRGELGHPLFVGREIFSPVTLTARKPLAWAQISQHTQ